MRIFAVEWDGPGRLAVVTRPTPDSIDAELRELRHAAFDTLVSLLGHEESNELGLSRETDSAAAAGLTFVSHPVPDFSVPTSDTFRETLFALHDRFRAGAGVAAHCRGSVGRSPLLIASLLVLDGADPDDAWSRLARARGLRVPDTDEQRDWIRTLSARRLPQDRLPPSPES